MNRINKIITTLIITFLFYHIVLLYASPENSAGEIKIYNASGEITATPGKLAAAVIAVEIPDGSYIYANPKGKGIGKATEVTIKKNRLLKSWEVRYPKGEKYQAKGDPDSVNVYRKAVRLPVAFEVKNDARDGSYSLNANLQILICSSSSCIPVERNIEIPVRVKRGILAGSPETVNNVGEFLSLGKKNNTDSSESKIQNADNTADTKTGIPESILFAPLYPEGKITGLLEAILFGLIAGFILNFMPCVLPVVSLKIMSFVMNAGEKKSVIVRQGFLFSAGIIASFILLAVLAAFSGYKWGALFQNRIFIIVMTSFIFAMGLSLFGVFTFNVPLLAGRAVSKTHGIYMDAFIKGVMATLLATPCSGPFLGGTLAWTLTRPPEIIFVIFLSVGLGMALPYMLLALNPSLLRVLPKPGVWMNYFETAMGFLLMFTVVYLVSISDHSGRMGLLLFLLFLSIGLWQFGKFGSPGNVRWKRGISFAILLIVAAAGYGLSFRYFFNGRVFSHERITFSPERILKNKDSGKVTVVEFTADWCPNCLLVEKLALEKDQVRELFARDDVEFMVADITRKNPQAESLMNRLGSKSIPLLSIFPPGEGFISPLCLRDIYSADDVAEAVNKAEKFLIKN